MTMTTAGAGMTTTIAAATTSCRRDDDYRPQGQGTVKEEAQRSMLEDLFDFG